ncbi:MAG: acyl-CoA synthetase [Dehalococcoidia bacterium]|nr:acyl-CoA synthetase [Dehalococcoidia bacterium]
MAQCEVYYYPPRMNAAYFLVDDNANKAPDRVAIYCGDEEITYGRLRELVDRLGNGLKELGVSKGDRVLCRFPNRPEAAVSFLAALKIGAIPISSFPFFREKETEFVLNNSGATVAIAPIEAVREIDAVRNSCKGLRHVITVGGAGEGHISYEALIESGAPSLEAEDTSRDDLAYLCYSSGTSTGTPKGFPHTHETLICSVDVTFPALFTVDGRDTVLGTAPFGFAFGLAYLILFPFRLGAGVVYVPEKLTGERVFQVLEKYRVTVMGTVAPLVHQMTQVQDAEKRYDLSRLRIVQTGASPVSQELFEEWTRRFKAELLPGYGLQETIAPLCGCRTGGGRPNVLGKLLPAWEARILDEEGHEAPAGQPGVQWLRVGRSLAPYYWNDPARTAASYKDGWFNTGDVVWQDEEGYMRFVGREDDVIKTSGWAISPIEIEQGLLSHPAVLEAAVVGIADPVKGQVPVAAVVLRSSHSKLSNEEIQSKLQRHIKARLAPFKCPKEIRVWQALPKTPTEKVIRSKVREDWLR